MNAFFVDPTHIHLNLSTAIRGPRRCGPAPGMVDSALHGRVHARDRGPLRSEDANLAGEALLAECIVLVSFRYPHCGPRDLPGPILTPDPATYKWTGYGRGLYVMEACKAIDCYEYQSCEHPGWRESGARSFCERLRRAVVATTADYDEARWQWTRELARQRGLTIGLLHRPVCRRA